MNTLEETAAGETLAQSTPREASQQAVCEPVREPLKEILQETFRAKLQEAHLKIPNQVPDEASEAPNEAHSETPESAVNIERKIGGFDGGTRSIFREPTIYLSIAIVFIAAMCLSGSPPVFWLTILPVSLLAIALHVLAERYLFSAKKEFEEFSAPFEGVFVITFGAILPGLGLLAYAIYSLLTASQTNVLEELGKLALLLAVPFFNFAVWSAVRKGYLVRPRLVGLMNGFTLGLSLSWTAILLRLVCFMQGAPACKFGWMLLLCLSPFLLFASFCLNLDLWQKTTANIRRITTSFSYLGILLSLLFVLVPFARESYVQSLIATARQFSAESAGAVEALRLMATDEDLRPSRYPVSGFALGALLIPNRGLEGGTDADRDLFFRITGKSFFSCDGKANKSLTTAVQESPSPLIGYKIPGLSLAKSQISGNIDATTLSSSVDWTLTFFNSGANKQEARAEIEIPKQTAVSRVTLWVNGEAREGAFAQTAKAAEAYRDVSATMMDPLLVTMTAPNRILIQCSPVEPNGGEMKIRLGFKVPLETSDGKTCSMSLPRILDSNFAQVRRHRISLVSKDMPVKYASGMLFRKNSKNYTLSGIIKTDDAGSEDSAVLVRRSAPFAEVATEDWYSHNRQFIVEKLQQAAISHPKRLLVVVDGSFSLRRDAQKIKDALASIPKAVKSTVYIVGKDGDNVSAPDNSATDVFAVKPPAPELSALSLEEAQTFIKPEEFIGGRDNWPVLKEAIETAAEKPGSAVLWIHGPQPLTRNSGASILDLVHRVCLYDLQIEAGENTLLPALQMGDVSGLITYEILRHRSTADDLKALLKDWKSGVGRLVVQRRMTEEKPNVLIISDRLVSAQVTGLWSVQEVARLQAAGRLSDAQLFAARYRLVSPLTAAVVLEAERDYAYHKLNPGAYKDAQTPQTSLVRSGYIPGLLGGTRFLFAPATVPASPSATFNTGGLVGAPVDPRYGQSNEVGQLADYGYDNARDLVRLLTVIALVISIIIAMAYCRRRGAKSEGTIGKAVSIVIAAPAAVYFLGLFMINNFGGIGGGL